MDFLLHLVIEKMEAAIKDTIHLFLSCTIGLVEMLEKIKVISLDAARESIGIALSAKDDELKRERDPILDIVNSKRVRTIITSIALLLTDVRFTGIMCQVSVYIFWTTILACLLTGNSLTMQ